MDTIEKALQKHQANRQVEHSTAEGSADSVDGVTPALQEDLQESRSSSSVEAAVQTTPQKVTNKDNVSNVKNVSNEVPLRGDYSPNFLSLDLAELARAGVIIPDDKRSKIKEEYKHIKRPLLQKASIDAPVEKHENLIMLTSAHSGEGKTFSSLNLAMSIAVERDRRVLLIDADVVKPGLGRMLGLQEKPGLVEYLNGDKKDLSEILLSTNVHNLTLMPAGKTHHLTHELLASKTMAELVDELSSRYRDRVVIFDSPPLLATSESKVLSRLVGQIVLVIEQDKTSQSAVQDALAAVEREKVSGLILNKSRAGRESYYGYYYSDSADEK